MEYDDRGEPVGSQRSEDRGWEMAHDGAPPDDFDTFVSVMGYEHLPEKRQNAEHDRYLDGYAEGESCGE